MTIHLLGDSYVENEPAENLGVKDHKRWYHLLHEEQGEQVLNHGQCGQGPAQTMDVFRDLYENNEIKSQDKLVIVLSHPLRIPWKWPLSTKPNKVSEKSISNDSATFYAMYYDTAEESQLDEYQEFAIGSIYDAMFSELSWANYYRLAFLKEVVKIPIICFTVYDINFNAINRFFPMKKYNFNLYSENFYWYRVPLFDHSMREWVEEDEEGNPIPMMEGMINHFSERNHVILKNIISNHFYKTKYDTKFHERFIHGTVTKDNFVDFIYE